MRGKRKLKFIKYFTICKALFQIQYMCYFKNHNCNTRVGALVILILQMRNHGPKNVNSFPKIIQLINVRAGIG